MATFTISGIQFVSNVRGEVISTPRAADFVLEGSDNLAITFSPDAEDELRAFLDVGAGRLDRVSLDGAPIDLLDDRYELYLTPYVLDGVNSTLAFVIDADSANAQQLSVSGYIFTLAGEPIVTGVPSAQDLQTALFATDTIAIEDAPIAPGDTVAATDFFGVEIGESAPVDFGLPAAFEDAPEVPDTPYDTQPATETTLSGTDEAEQIIGGTASERIEAGAGDDTLGGRENDDVLLGGAGDDEIAASDGNDFVFGGDGNDSIGGGLGNDQLEGEAGNDTLGGGFGDDYAEGGLGNDVLALGAGNDTAVGGEGDDTAGGSQGTDLVFGGVGNDSLGGGFGQDTLVGGEGDDSIGGGEGNDVVFGGDGDDFLAGGGRDDAITGGAGDDTINGGVGNDTISGGEGADLFVWSDAEPGNGSVDFVTDFEDGVDQLRFDNVPFVPGSGLQGRLDSLDVRDELAGGETAAVLSYNGDTVVLLGVSAADLTIEDFVFL
ncbi:Hemolysin, plasmid [Roseivivax jejudonensis]|uniref:Hemolysin, plasmid n=1 Tax=Roseivivax jejudonensis TaxID=1529041 RepID=A0A1X6ZNH9_9RHOB|nr:calcium-binding protein [Roseivivax jejudonensis]SLN56779.1 Hemolysin, plasmid [Roseivivax jejudonensis]